MRETTVTKRTPAAKKRIEIPSPENTSTGEFYKKVQEKAYELYVARGCSHGYDVEDWITAEQIVRRA